MVPTDHIPDLPAYGPANTLLFISWLPQAFCYSDSKLTQITKTSISSILPSTSQQDVKERKALRNYLLVTSEKLRTWKGPLA